MRTIYAIRHGQARFGTDDYDRLSPLGIAQAERLGGYLHRAGVRFDAVYTGTHLRQQETAAAVAGQMPGTGPAIPLAAFDEFNADAILALCDRRAGSATAAFDSPEAFRTAMEAAVAEAITAPDRLAPEDRLDGFVERVRMGIDRIAADTPAEASIAVFTSGGTLSAFMQIALGLGLSVTVQLPWHIVNTAVSVFLHDGRRLMLKSFNNAAHLEHAGERSLYTLL